MSFREEAALVKRTAAERGYTVPVLVDRTGDVTGVGWGVFGPDDGVTVVELFDCSSTPVPCVSDRSHIPGGNGQFTILLGTGDPVIGTR